MTEPETIITNPSHQEQPELPQESLPQSSAKDVRLRFVIVFVTVFCVIGVFVAIFSFFRPELKEVQKMVTTSLNKELNVTPTPAPFAALTIPYLRARTYQSELGPQALIGETASYDSYLTSYDSDGLKINALLTKPLTEMPEGGYPAIVFVHGYIPPTQYVTTERYVSYVDYLAKSGFVVFKIDLRGHGDSEGQASGAYYSSDYIIDTLNAYAALQSAGFVNPNKIGLWGHSMAGNVVMRSFAAKPSIPAVVIWAGAVYTYTDMQEYRINDASYRPPSNTADRTRERQRLNDTYGQPSSTSAFWKQVAVTDYLKDLKGAIQIHHATNDDVVNIGYSRGLNALLDQTSVSHEFYEYPSGGHNLEGVSFAQAMSRTVDFFKKYLQ